MATIDIREQDKEIVIDKIIFDEPTGVNHMDGYCIKSDNPSGISYHFTIEGAIDSVCISSKQSALNLIKAIEKAIELGFVQ